jgi:raffinose/stachyose/melibiose transport system permease protein
MAPRGGYSSAEPDRGQLMSGKTVTSARWRERLSPYLYVLPALLVFLLFKGYPTLHNLYLTLFDWDGISPDKTFVGLANYLAMLDDYILGRALLNTGIYVAVTVVTEVGGGLLLALLFNIGFRGSAILRMLAFSPFMIPMVAVGILWSLILDPYVGILNQLLRALGLEALALPWLGHGSTALASILVVSFWKYVGFNMILFFGALQRLPRQLYEAAYLDGASRWQVFRRVTVPLLRDTTTVVTLYCIIGGINMFDLFWVMTQGGPAHSTEILSTWAVLRAFKFFQMGYGAAIVTVVLMLCLIATIVYLGARQRKEGVEY